MVKRVANLYGLSNDLRFIAVVLEKLPVFVCLHKVRNNKALFWINRILRIIKRARFIALNSQHLEARNVLTVLVDLRPRVYSILTGVETAEESCSSGRVRELTYSVLFNECDSIQQRYCGDLRDLATKLEVDYLMPNTELVEKQGTNKSDSKIKLVKKPKKNDWKPPKGYIGSKEIVNDYEVPRSTIQGWAERDKAKVKKDPQTREVYYIKKWFDKRFENYKPRRKS